MQIRKAYGNEGDVNKVDDSFRDNGCISVAKFDIYAINLSDKTILNK